MQGLLHNKVALITAGASGIGAAISRVFAGHGARVIIHYRGGEDAAKRLRDDILAAGGRALTAQADLRDADAVNAAFAHASSELGPIDILVNNASIFLDPKPVESLLFSDLQAEFEGSMMTAFNATQAVLPGMLERGGGRILFMVGTMLERPATGYAAHAVGKGAMLAYARTMAKELGPRGIAVHCISPGMALTPNVLKTVPEGEREALRKKTPIRRLQTPEEIAGLAVFLASDLAASATALHLNADGGLADLGGI
ncbi:MAG TPA: SDR family oxidoreductase [Armatimonadota bacterium]|jgi:3-oxoacyl-[acyl-carrier protein] reductase